MFVVWTARTRAMPPTRWRWDFIERQIYWEGEKNEGILLSWSSHLSKHKSVKIAQNVVSGQIRVDWCHFMYVHTISPVWSHITHIGVSTLVWPTLCGHKTDIHLEKKIVVGFLFLSRDQVVIGQYCLDLLTCCPPVLAHSNTLTLTFVKWSKEWTSAEVQFLGGISTKCEKF